MIYKKTLGLEIHAQIDTKTKLFSRSLVDDAAEPNSQVDFLDAGMPGALPVPNENAINMALTTCLALNMEINNVSIFDRKHYFYQDSPLGYQITQFYKPIGINGYIDCSFGRVRINRLHIESDAGKSIYSEGHTYVDLNRAGVPLMEIVTEPDLHNEEEIVEFLKELQAILLAVKTCKCDMEKGNFRVDVNLSLSKENEPLGTRTEVKNLNSFSSIRKAICVEEKFQTERLKEGKEIFQETKLFDCDKNETRTIRNKENAADYAYFPDPDLLPVYISPEKVEETRRNLPMLPKNMREILFSKNIASKQVYTLTETIDRFAFFMNLMEELTENMISEFLTTCPEEFCETFLNLPSKKSNKFYSNLDNQSFFASINTLVENIYIKVSNWVCSELLGKLAKLDILLEDLLKNNHHFADNFGKIISLNEKEEITRTVAKAMIDIIIEKDATFDELFKNSELLKKVEVDLDSLIENMINNSSNEVEKFKKGKVQIVMYFVGQIMKETKGQCNADTIKEKVLISLQKRI